MKLNPYILLVMKWLDDKSSVTIEELRKNVVDAYAYAADADAADAAADAYAYAYAAYDYADADDAAATHWINKYFETTGENKQNYIDKIEKDKK